MWPLWKSERLRSSRWGFGAQENHERRAECWNLKRTFLQIWSLERVDLWYKGKYDWLMLKNWEDSTQVAAQLLGSSFDIKRSCLHGSQGQRNHKGSHGWWHYVITFSAFSKAWKMWPLLNMIYAGANSKRSELQFW